jgi:hypothetical protein
MGGRVKREHKKKLSKAELASLSFASGGFARGEG